MSTNLIFTGKELILYLIGLLQHLIFPLLEGLLRDNSTDLVNQFQYPEIDKGLCTTENAREIETKVTLYRDRISELLTDS